MKSALETAALFVLSALASLLSGLAVVSLTACASVPEPLWPQVRLDPQTSAPPGTAPGSAPRTASGQAELSALDWRRAVPDPALHRVVDSVLAANRDLDIALARLDAARAGLRLQDAEGNPSLNVEASAQRERSSLEDPRSRGSINQPGFERNTNVLSTGGTLSWEADLFGRNRAAVRAAGARYRAEQAAVVGTELSLVADSALLYAELRALQARLKLADDALRIETELAEISAARRRGGQVSAADVLRAEGQTETSRTAVASLEVQLEDALHRLALLLDTHPAKAEELLGDSPLPLVAEALFTPAMPSELLRRRPDLIEAEARLEAASSEVAVAALAAYPRLSLSATLGWVAASAADLASADALTAGLGPTLNWPLVDFGRVRAQVDQREAEEREALTRYEQALNTAFAEAETSLRKASAQREQAKAAAAAVVAYAEAWEVLAVQYRAGIVDLSAVLDTRRSLNSAQSDEVEARRELLAAYFTFYKALGGEGWPGPGPTPQG